MMMRAMLAARTLGSRRPDRVAHWPGLHGHVRSPTARADDEESIRTVHRALDLGVTFFDTADVYGNGENERLVGTRARTAPQGRRARDQVRDWLAPGEASRRVDGSPAHIWAACDASLARLRTDVIDLYYLHRVDPRDADRGQRGCDGGARSRGQGAVHRVVGGVGRRRSAEGMPSIRSPPCRASTSLWFREPEARVLPVCRELGIGFVPFSPIGRGFLAGNVTGVDELARRRHAPPRAALHGRSPRTKHRARRPRSSRIAARQGCTPAQLSLAWLLARETTSCRFRARSGGPTSRRTSRAADHRAHRRRGRRARHALRAGRRVGRALPRRHDAAGGSRWAGR